jgi:hypothetical protein
MLLVRRLSALMRRLAFSRSRLLVLGFASRFFMFLSLCLIQNTWSLSVGDRWLVIIYTAWAWRDVLLSRSSITILITLISIWWSVAFILFAKRWFLILGISFARLGFVVTSNGAML